MSAKTTPTLEVSSSIKKKPGRLLLAPELLQWRSDAGDVSEAMRLDEVQGMQATPPTSAKLRLKLTGNDGRTLMIEFSAAGEFEKARNELQAAIKAHREGPAKAQPAASSGATPGAEHTSSKSTTPQSVSQSASQSPAPSGAAKSKSRSSKKVSLDPAKLMQNLDLQRSVLQQDPELMRTFQQVVITSGALTNEQFWALRVHLLITAAQQQAQTRGSYNVLSTIKPATSGDNRININLTREKISDVFDQYPIVRKAYNESVPKLSEGEFWQRFFMSRLFLVLRGEKVTQNHPTDAVLDPYIDVLHKLRAKQWQHRAAEDSQHPAPSFVNVEANAENNPETFGNNIVTTAGGGTRGLIRSMNGLSHRLLLGKRKEREAEREAERNEFSRREMEDELRLHDLAPQEQENSSVGLRVALPNENSSCEETGETAAALAAAAPSTLTLNEVGTDNESLVTAATIIDALIPNAESKVSETVSDEVLITQTTSLEFLRQFWHAQTHNSTSEAVALRGYLTKSLERVKSVQKHGELKSLQDAIQRALNVADST